MTTENIIQPVSTAAPVETVSQEANVKTDTNLISDAVKQPTKVEDISSLISEDLKLEKSLSSFKDVNSLAKSYVELTKKLGKRIDELSPEELTSVYKKFGVPEKPEGYEIKTDIESVDPDFVKTFTSKAKEFGLSKDSASKLFDWYTKDQLEARQQYEESIKLQSVNNIESLKKEFGVAFDERVALANRAVNTLGGDELRKVLVEANLGTNPIIIKALSEIGKLYMEDKDAGNINNAKLTPTTSEVEMKIKEKLLDVEFKNILSNPFHPKYSSAKEEMDKLFDMKYKNSR